MFFRSGDVVKIRDRPEGNDKLVSRNLPLLRIKVEFSDGDSHFPRFHINVINSSLDETYPFREFMNADHNMTGINFPCGGLRQTSA